jgi:hypothetical protein
VSEAHHLRKHQDVEPKYPKRKETIKHVLADENGKHGIRWNTFRGLKIFDTDDAYFRFQ